MDHKQPSKLQLAIDEVKANGFGEVIFRVVIKNGHVDYTQITKQNTYKKLTGE